MAKKQSFSDKIGRKTEVKNHIKLIRSGWSEKTGALRFNEEMVQIPDGKSADAVVKELLAKKV
tara:strand:- start:29 stop:217 length:189 start_codon:yes stop_codon:yes gene_type:complete